MIKGDILNYTAPETDWNEWYMKLAYYTIEQYQKAVLGKFSNYFDIHSMTYFDKKHIFSVEPPVTKWVTLEEIEDKNYSVYRYTYKKLTKADTTIMRDAAEKMIGVPYDVGQLIDIGFQEVLGYPPYIDKLNIFDFSKKMRMCSAGVGIIYRAFTKYAGLPKLFSMLNPNYWKFNYIDKFYKHGGYWRIEQYPPAIFANSCMFADEFKLI